MLQYIINTTAIWLLGLIVFDLLLRKEAHHGYNRLYLLLVMFAGALVPLWSWDYDAVIYTTGVSRPIAEQTAVVRDAIVAGTEQQLLGWEDWLQIIYLSGVGIGVLLFFKDIITIVLLYRSGVKSKDGTWTVVETGKATSPFSAFRYVFVSSRDNYSHDELQMILAHEEQHGHLLHFIDVLICRLFTILFWFNPMPYLLQHRLLMVHEYQADAAVKNNPSTYGQFLIEQSVLNTAPVLAHSFTRSPLKKRILMLTRKTTAFAKGKQLLIAPVMLIAMLCFTKNAFSGDEPKKDGNKITYKGNVIGFGDKRGNDTVEVTDPATGVTNIVITSFEPLPLTLNGETIYRQPDRNDGGDYINVATTGSTLNNTDLKRHMLDKMKKEFSKLDDGIYDFNPAQHVVLDKNGKVAYYEVGSFSKIVTKGKSENWEQLNDKIKKRWSKKIGFILNNLPVYEPATKDGKAVPVLIDEMLNDRITIKGGKIISN